MPGVDDVLVSFRPPEVVPVPVPGVPPVVPVVPVLGSLWRAPEVSEAALPAGFEPGGGGG